MKLVSIIGGASATSAHLDAALELGERLAEAGYGVVCGGLGGVMARACSGASSRGGITVGILPGDDPDAANPFVQIRIATGAGSIRNRAVVLSGFAVCALGGGYGTLSEIAFALQAGRPVCAMGDWASVPGVTPAATAEEMAAFVKNAERGLNAHS
jgi:uncharacterized protein (TIGR00725 family)